MSTRTPKGCFFLDSCVLISEILNENDSRIRKFKTDVDVHDIPCFFSDSVEIETNDKITGTIDFLGKALRETIQIHLEETRKKRHIAVSDPISNDDIRALEELFNGFHSAVRTSGVVLPNPLSFIETWIVSYLAKILDDGTSISIDDFIKEMVKSILKLTSEIQNSLDFLVTFEKSFVKRKSIPFNPIVSASLEGMGIHSPDSDHIASAIVNQCSAKETTIFVTLDFRTILNKRNSILTNFKMMCCDPLYAVHHL